ncbi:hypothetical protein Sa4125_07970 [Aureimonas sp. SA4125]|uniref:hypothetical protein n=1 Tax=Aureimonas sp. SA4125 TaxID=2826993 RepID=UPI001CC7185E|nr:hypothetical protein [Aureimonas sp. SA4125]BDA83255.1 hypothetical protein Sa4125_07970 [Aureimonas sp. SA4125]
MIATGLTFLLGVLVAALVVLLLAPIVWRKAQSLARRDYEATIPASANEIRAEFDSVRAAAALSVRQQEIRLAEAREKTVRAQAQLGRSTVENVEILKRNRSLLEIAEDRAMEIARLTTTLAARDDENQSLTRTLAATRREAEMSGQELSALASRFEALGEIAEERKIQLVAAEAKVDRLSDAQRVGERLAREQQATIERLRTEAAGFEHTIARDKATLAQLNERIAALLTGIAERDTEIARLADRQAVPAAAPSKSPRAAETVPTDTVALPSGPQSSPSSPERLAEVQTASQRLRAALVKNADSASPETSQAEIRDRISDIAARVIRMTSVADDPNAALGLGAAGSASTPAGDGRAPSLAERVRRLATAEPNGGPGSTRSQSAAAHRE